MDTVTLDVSLQDRLPAEVRTPCNLRFGVRSVSIELRTDEALDLSQFRLPEAVRTALLVPPELDLGLFRPTPSTLALGPYVGLLISDHKLRLLQGGERDSVYCRYAQYARQDRTLLLFLTPSGINLEDGTVTGFLHACDAPAGCTWQPIQAPLPRVIYDRCFGREGRAAAIQLREAAAALGAVVLNRPPKITKMQAFEALQSYRRLAPHLPFTARLSRETLEPLLSTHTDLYLKPDSLYKGKGVFRLRRQAQGWALSEREAAGNTERYLPTREDLFAALDELLPTDLTYVVQEGIPLATYLGNRFDLRSLVQRDGQGHWRVSGVVARIGAPGSAITSPRSGGEVAMIEDALASAFGEKSSAVGAEIERVSLEIAGAVDKELGPCAELGLDLGVATDGSVHLIEVNGIPLRVSLERLHDPLIAERIHRHPIQYTAYLDRLEDTARQPPTGPVVGILLGPKEMAAIEANPRYASMDRVAREAGAIPYFLDLGGLTGRTDQVSGWILSDGTWRQQPLPVPDVIYNRATFPNRSERLTVRATLKELQLSHPVQLLNGTNAFSKAQVAEALHFFPDTARLTPETRFYQQPADLLAMLERFPQIFLKANHGSHGDSVASIRPESGGWRLRGKLMGRWVDERFDRLEDLTLFLQLMAQVEPWMLQQGIDLPSIQGRIFDMRVILQKNGDGHWEPALQIVRHAQPNQVAANMSQGAEPYLPHDFIDRFGKELPDLPDLAATAGKAALQTAQALEARFGRMGEIGVDIGIDRQGRPWVFEANTKPLHPTVPGVDPETLLRRPFAYAAYLAERCWTGRKL